MLEIKIEDWYNLHGGKSFKLHLKPGLNILVGPNGSGKTTAIRQIEEYARKHGIAKLSYNNMTSGGTNANDYYLHTGNFELLMASATSSEGQAIMVNLGPFFSRVGQMVRTLQTTEPEENRKCVITFDGVDSGLDILNIEEIKDGLDFIMNNMSEAKVTPYIVFSTNNYELTRGITCISIKSGKEVSFADYEAWRKWILNYYKKKGKKTDGKE